MKNRSFGKIIKYAILGLGYFEAVVGILQWLGVLYSHHYGYAFTGTFYNPGPYACFLSIMVPIALSMMTENVHRMERWVGTGMVLFCVILIPATLSRTAIVACCIGCAFAIRDRIRSCIRNIRRKHVLYGIIMIVVASFCLYIMKKDSANGRMLMWKVAATAAINAPLTGVGWDNVAGEYGEAQERYFASGKATEKEAFVADAPEYVFNEYIQVAIAFGPFTAILMIAILTGGIATAFKNHNYGIAGSAVAVAIVLFSSYPLQFTLFVITIVMLLIGCFLSAKSVLRGAIGVGITICCFVLFQTNSHRTDVNSEFHIAHSLHRQGRHQKSNEMLLHLKRHSADPMILNIIGKNFQSLGMTDSAIYYMEKSTFRCPNRMYPHYLLMKLYCDSNSYNMEARLHEARIILSMTPKVESEATRDMKREAALNLKIYKNL